MLAVTSLARAKSLPDVPTLDESGLKGFDATAWFGLYMPAAEGSPALAKLEAAMKEILASDDIRTKFEAQGLEPGKLFGAQFKEFVNAEIAKWGSVVQRADVKVEQ